MKRFFCSLLLPLAVGTLAGLITRNAMQAYGMLEKPPLSPPAWLFPVVWTILYILMGISAYLITMQGSEREEVQSALMLYHLQLFFNFIWPILFFLFERYLLAFLCLVVLWVLVFLMIKKFAPISKTAAYLNVPYLLWLTFAAYLNLAVYLEQTGFLG